MIRLISITKKQFRELAFKDFLPLFLKSLFRSDKILIYALDTSQVEIDQKEDAGLIEIRKADISELEDLESRAEPAPWEFQCHHYDGVKDFFIASKAEEIQHISWIYYTNDPNRFIKLGHNDAEIKYCITLPRFRGQGIYPRVLRTIAGYLKEKKFRRVFISTHENNRFSIRGIEKAGFKHVGQIRLRKVLGIQISKRYVPQEV